MVEVKLSIIIPVYNTEKYLCDCIESIITCKRKDFEIIVINDGSLDNSYEIIKKYEQSDNRIIAIDKKNSGVSDTRNYGIKVAHGKYIMFVDSDDYLSKDWDKIIDYLKNDDIYYCTTLIDSKINKKKMMSYIIGNNDKKIMMAGPISRMFKRKFLIEKNIFFDVNISNGEDLLFNIYALINCTKYSIINKSIYYYRMFIGQCRNKDIDKLIDSTEIFTRKIDEIFGDNFGIIEYFHIRALKVIINRISNNFNFIESRARMQFLLKYPFNEYVNTGIKCKDKKNKFFCKLCKKEQYLLIYLLFKIKKKNKKESVVNLL